MQTAQQYLRIYAGHGDRQLAVPRFSIGGASLFSATGSVADVHALPSGPLQDEQGARVELEWGRTCNHAMHERPAEDYLQAQRAKHPAVHVEYSSIEKKYIKHTIERENNCLQ